MCLAIPGEIRSVHGGELRTGRVAFGEVVREVCLAYVPEAAVGDFVVVHAGFAIARLDRAEAERTLVYLDEAAAALEAERGPPARDREPR
ncbi:MAG: HypC/HybG/HupF family hydrogenase formation chaperone [Deltaproteobacteria bacterium]|nr:HypC/HybG/HupF family hydrogenase formation chaperone [Deltaproteobacteria bacterium]